MPYVESYLLWSAQAEKRVGLNSVGRGFVQESRLTLTTDYWLLAEESALAIFPSYLRHGTESLLSDVERMTLDIDALPSPT